MGSYESHFNVSLTVRVKVTRQCVHKPQPFFLEELNALPLAQTGSPQRLFKTEFCRMSVLLLTTPKIPWTCIYIYIGPCEIPSGLEIWVTPGLLWSTGAIKSCGQHASLPGHCARAARRESRAHGTPLKARILAHFARRVGLAERPGKRKCCYLFMFTSVRSCHRRSSHLRLA